MADKDKLDYGDVSKLAPEARSRVELALKRSIEAELQREAGGIVGPEAMVHSRSKGFFFSRSKTSDILRRPDEESLLRNVESMGEAEFGKFAERLTQLKKARGD